MARRSSPLCWLLPVLATAMPGLQAAEATSFDSSRSLNLLGQAVQVLDEIDTLPATPLFFLRDQEDAREDLQDLLAQTIQALEVPEIADLRGRYRGVEAAIQNARDSSAALRERRLSAPEEDVSTLTRLTPTQTLREFTARTRGDYDLLIGAHQTNIAAWEAELDALEGELSAALGRLGIDLPPEQLELWLSSAIGDDILTMSVVFSSIRGVTQQLAELTRESNENLDYARRYYGMVVNLHRLVVQMQQDFIDKVDKEILPRLTAFYGEADSNIAQARQLLADGGKAEILANNIAANELTQEAIALYAQVVEEQRGKVQEALQLSLKEEQLAINTYKTVRLSSDVSLLIRNGLDTFELLSTLQVPVAAAFENQALREEFRRLTEKLLQGS